MRKRLSSKVLAVILTLAICATTVFGCLMTVSAAESCYSFGDSKFNGDDLTQATIDVTFTAPAKLPNGFAAGAFAFSEVNANGEDHLIFKSVTSNDVNVTIEDNYVLFDNMSTDGNGIVVDGDAAVKTAKFTFTVGFSTGAATDRTYQIALSDIELAYNDAEYYTEAAGVGKNGEITAACKHVIGVVGTPNAKNEANNYSVYKESVCTKCGETFGYQLVPTADENDLVSSDSTTATTGTIDLLEFSDDLVANGSTSKYYDSVVADNGETGADWDNAIIIDSAEEFVYLCKGAENDATKGKYYKVADGIAGFNLSTSALDLNGTLAENLATIQGSGKNHAGGTNVSFQGNFDGNGITVYGAVCSSGSYSGLFSFTKGDVTIKNVNVKLSSFIGTNAAGGIVGYHSGDGTNSLIIENCSVTDTYLETKGTGWGCGVGAIIGHEANLSSWKEADKGVDGNGDGDTADTIYVNGTCNITNCYVNLDPTYFVSTSASTNVATRGGIVGWCTTNAMKADKCVVIGVTPYATNQSATDNNVQHMGLETHFTNVYTDTGATQAAIGGTLGTRNFTNKIFVLTNANMKGSAAVVNMPNLDWGTTWIMDGTNTYPRLALPGETSDTIYWDGSVASSIAEGSGKKEDPYVINTAAELAWLVQQKANVTDGNYYKIADGIESIVLQPYAYINDIKALDSASAVKSYFESGTFTAWKTTGWEGACFAGYFDGNGATIYGMYATSINNAALFCTVDGGAAFVNLTIKNSYLTSSADNYQVGALIGTSSSTGYGATRDGIIWVKNITIANNYMYNGCLSTEIRRSGIIGGAQEAIQVENALIYGNDATYGRDAAIYNMPLIANCYNSIAVADTHYDGLEIKTGMADLDKDTVNETTVYYNQVKNSIILGADVANTKDGRGYRKNDPETFTNVYTDGASGTVSYSDGQWTYTDDQIKGITASDAMGSGAADAMPNLAWGTDWYCGIEGEYPVQAVFATFGTSSVSNAYLELVGHNTTYNNDGSVDLNFHFVPKTSGAAPVLYVGTLDGSKFMKLNATTSSLTSQLGSDALMYTLPNLSARDIDLVWLPTLVNDGSTLKEWGKSEQLALADNAKAILAGNYDTADKNVAAALLNYGSASGAALDIDEPNYDAGTIDLLEFGDYLTAAGSTSKYYDTVLADNGETGSSWDNAIIIDSAEEFVYLCKASGNDTKGKYYKVADGIAGFDLSNGKLDYNKGLAANLDTIKAGGKNHAGNTPGFQGSFDGNGITVYGAWTNHNSISHYAGLFTATQGDVTIKNVHVKLASFTAKTAAGGIVGYYKGEGTFSNNTTLTIENCSVTDSHFELTGTGYGTGIGAIVGRVDCPSSYADANDEDGDGNITETLYVNNAINVTNCYVNLDDAYFTSAREDDSEVDQICHGGAVAVAGTNAVMVSNCIVIGITPYPTTEYTAGNAIQHTAHANNFSNVYTDQLVSDAVFVGGTTGSTQNLTTVMTQLTTEQLTGLGADANMPALDWNTVWTTTNGYPTFINKNYEAPASGYAIYWDGSSTKTAPTVGSGTPTDPYIISTVAEFAYITGQSRDNYAITLGKYYKIADGITSIVMQPEAYAADIMALGSAAETKAYFEANAANLKQWLHYGWEGSTFCGNIDFNGATVYGIYQVSTNNAGLISNVDAGAVISNLSIRNSYMTSTAGDYQVGAIAAVTNAKGYGQDANGFVWFNNCIVANNYLHNRTLSTKSPYDRSGLIIGASSDLIYIDNCLTYGNDATFCVVTDGVDGDNITMPIWSSANNNVLVSSAPTIPEGLVTVTDGASTPRYYNIVRNSIILGAKPYDLGQVIGSRFNDPKCFVNVYTDANVATDTFTGGTKLAVSDNQIKTISTADALGADAKTNMPNLDWNIWYVGAAGDYPGFKEAGDMPLSSQTLYNAIVLDTMDDYGDSVTSFGMYAPGLNLKVNPYMTFTFEFGGEYQRSENVVVTFKSGNTVIETVTAADMINNEDAGRFHLYRLKSAPVTALATGISVSVSYNGGAAVDFGTYSAEGFALTAESANKIEPCSYYATRYEAAKALLFYAQMLDARYGA